MAIASQLYSALARLRRTKVETTPGASRRLNRPVVSIGNLVVGGSGKTPLAALVARLLAEAGERPAVLSRGYARTDPDDGVTIVSDGQRLRADLARAGDEPLLLARSLPGVAVLVCADRYLAGCLAEQHLGATVHVLDDGFQHMQLARDVNLLIVDRADVERPRLLPSGRLREPLSAARAADAVLVTGAEGDQVAEVAQRLGVAESFALHRDVEPAVEETVDGPRPLGPGARVRGRQRHRAARALRGRSRRGRLRRGRASSRLATTIRLSPPTSRASRSGCAPRAPRSCSRPRRTSCGCCRCGRGRSSWPSGR